MDALPLPPPGHDQGHLRDVVIKAVNELEKILKQIQNFDHVLVRFKSFTQPFESDPKAQQWGLLQRHPQHQEMTELF